MTARGTSRTRSWIFAVLAVIVVMGGVGGADIYSRQHRRLSSSAIQRDQRADFVRSGPASR